MRKTCAAAEAFLTGQVLDPPHPARGRAKPVSGDPPQRLAVSCNIFTTPRRSLFLSIYGFCRLYSVHCANRNTRLPRGDCQYWSNISQWSYCRMTDTAAVVAESAELP